MKNKNNTLRNAFRSIILFALLTSPSYAMPPFVAADYSGDYICKGKNDSVGDYEVLVKLTLNTETSHNIYGIYDFSTEGNQQAIYTGQILAKGRQFSMTFKLLHAPDASYSTGMGEFKRMSDKRWRFHSTYYEPDGSGGNFGNDYCTMKEPEPILSNPLKNLQKANKVDS